LLDLFVNNQTTLLQIYDILFAQRTNTSMSNEQNTTI